MSGRSKKPISQRIREEAIRVGMLLEGDVVAISVVGAIEDIVKALEGLAEEVRTTPPSVPADPPDHACPTGAEHVSLMFCRATGTEGDDFLRNVQAVQLEHLPREGEPGLGVLVFEDSKGREPMRLRRWEPPEGSPAMVELRYPIAPAVLDRLGPLAGRCAAIFRRLIRLGEPERRIVEAIIARLELGRERYGELHLDDGRDWRAEATEELLDAMVYQTIAEMVEAQKPDLSAAIDNIRTEGHKPPTRRCGVAGDTCEHRRQHPAGHMCALLPGEACPPPAVGEPDDD